MLNIPKKYQVEENGSKTGVLLDVEIYNKIEKIIEQNGLRHLIEEESDKDIIVAESTGIYNKFG